MVEPFFSGPPAADLLRRKTSLNMGTKYFNNESWLPLAPNDLCIALNDANRMWIDDPEYFEKIEYD